MKLSSLITDAYDQRDTPSFPYPRESENAKTEHARSPRWQWRAQELKQLQRELGLERVEAGVEVARLLSSDLEVLSLCDPLNEDAVEHFHNVPV